MKLFFFCILLVMQGLIGKEYHHALGEERKFEKTYVWEQKTEDSFNELIVSWNAFRPIIGSYSLSIRVFLKEWSPWFLYATWGQGVQKMYKESHPTVPVKVSQNVLEITGVDKSTRFQVRVEGKENALLNNFFSLHVCSSDRTSFGKEVFNDNKKSVFLPVRGLSQMSINSVHRERICSPVSTTAVMRYLSKSMALDPLQFAYQVRDQNFDIFGNWVLNTAQAFQELQGKWHTWVERLDGFERVYSSLKEGCPVIISVRSPLPGSAREYKEGHIIAIIGYDADSKEVLCMDPAFLGREESYTRYSLENLLEAWARRGYIAYLFQGDKVSLVDQSDI